MSESHPGTIVTLKTETPDFERWINTLGTVAVSLVLLSLAWAFRPPPKQA
jgi:hypothetical protein